MKREERPVDLLRRVGWSKGQMWAGDGGLCILGAMMRCDAIGVLDVGTIIREQFPDRLGTDGARVIVPFNDHPDTTFADVELVLEKAELRRAEGVQ